MLSSKGDWLVRMYKDARGREPVGEFLDGLPAGVRSRVFDSVDLLERLGTGLGMPHASHVSGYPFWELRVSARGHAVRVFYVARPGREMVLLHAFEKKSRRAPTRELNMAMRRYADLIEREGGEQ